MDNIYLEKYLKYKTKYLNLKKNSIGGVAAAMASHRKKSGTGSGSEDRLAHFKKLEEEEKAAKIKKCNDKIMEINNKLKEVFEKGTLHEYRVQSAEAKNKLNKLIPTCNKDEIKKHLKSLDDNYKIKFKKSPKEQQLKENELIKKSNEQKTKLKKWTDRVKNVTTDRQYNEFNLMYIRNDPSLISDADKKKYGDLAGVQIFTVPLYGSQGITEVFGRNTAKSIFGSIKYCLHKKGRSGRLDKMYEKVRWGDNLGLGNVKTIKYGNLKFNYNFGDLNSLYLTHPHNIALIRGEITDKKISKEANEKIHKEWLVNLTKNNHTYEAIVDVLKKGEDEVNKNQREAVQLYNKATKCG